MRNIFSFRTCPRGIPVLAASLIGLIAISACTIGPGAPAPTAAPTPQNPSPAAGVVMIGFAAPEFERQAYEPLIAAFNEQNPGIHVQFVPLDETSGAQSLDQLMRQTVSAADTAAVFFLRPEDIKNGLVRDLKPLMDADTTFDHDDFYPGALETAGSNGGVYMLPHTIRISLLSYNKDLWAKRGLSAPKPDWTWNDLIAAAEQLAQKRGDTVEVYGLVEGRSGATALEGLLAAAGVNLSTTPAEHLRLDRPEVAAALERVAALVKSGAIYAGADSSQPPAPDAFQKLIANQQAAMWFGAPILIGPDTSRPAFAVGSAALPPSAASNFDGAEGYIMSSGAAHPQEAWRWLSFLSQQAVKRPFLDGNIVNLVPARKSLAERSGYWKQLDTETTAAVHATLAHAGALTSEPSDDHAAAALSQALAAVVGGKPTAQAIAEAQAALDRQIAEAQAAPSPTPNAAPVAVATPAPDQPAPGATTISFNVPLFQASDFRRLAGEFNRQHSELFVQVKSTRLDEAPTPANMAAGADCFTWPDPIGSGDITATLDLQPLADADADAKIDDYPPTLLAPFKQGTALHGLPYQVNLRALTYNQTAFDAARLAHPSAAWTMDDFLNAAKQLTGGEGQDQSYGFAAPGLQTEDIAFFLNRFGATATQGSGATLQPNFTDPKVVQAARFYVDLLKNYSPHKHLQGYTRDGLAPSDAPQLIDEGRVGMWFDFGDQVFIIGPGVAGRQNVTRAIAPPPLGDGPATADDVKASGLYISATTQHPEACWQWLKYLSNDLSALRGSFPARRSLATSEAFLKGAPTGAADVYTAYGSVLDRAPGADSGQAGPNRAPIDFFWLFRAIDRALQGKDLERELTDAQALTAQYLTCVRSGTAAGTCAKQVDPTYEGLAGSGENN